VSYKELVLYFMSGTGNTYRVARWMADAASAGGLAVELHQVGFGTEALDRASGPARLTGVLMPTHAFTAPWPIIKLAFRLPRGKGTHAFVVATRAGTKFGRVNLPGLEGTACYLTALILALKGYNVRGVQALDMPSNWIAAHSGLKPANVTDIVAKAKVRADGFIRRILDGRTRWGEFVFLALGVLLIPVTLGYLVYGRFGLGKLWFADNRCNSCGLCAKSCPFNAIRMLGRKEPRPYWTLRCESCMRCMAFCPEKAIQAGHSWAVILFSLASIPFSVYLLNWLSGYYPAAANLKAGLAGRVIQYPFYVAVVVLAYAVFWRLVRWPVVNTLFTYTTFTRLFRRYHEPGTRLGELASGKGQADAEPEPR